MINNKLIHNHSIMQNFQQILTQAAQLKQHQLKKDRKGYQMLPQFLKSGLGYNKKYENIRKQHFLYQFRVSHKVKQEGNILFKQNKIEQALNKYQESLSIFRYIQSKTYENMKDQDLTYHLFQHKLLSQNLKNKYQSLLIALYLNICSCLTKLNKKQDAIFSADQALKIKKTAKGHYKKAQAYLKYVNKEANDVKLGLLQLKQAYSLDKDPQILKEMQTAKQSFEKQQQKSKNWFKFMFDKSKQAKQQISQSEGKEKEKEKKKIIEQKVQNDSITKIQQFEKEATKGLSQSEKLKSTKQKLNIYINMKEDEWEYFYQKDFIKRHGSKIYHILKTYKCEDLAVQFRAKLANCLEREEKLGKNKSKCQECIQWLKSHPMNKIAKYVQRYHLQINWIKQQRIKYFDKVKKAEKQESTIQKTRLQTQAINSDNIIIQQPELKMSKLEEKKEKLNSLRKQLQAQYSQQQTSRNAQGQINKDRNRKMRLATVTVVLLLLLVRFVWN